MRALIVEDDPISRRVLEQVLRSKGHDVTSCDDAESGWQAFLKGTFPLVLLDWVLPGLDGLEFCKRLKGHPKGKGSLVLMVTARSKPGDLQKVLNAGADDYFPKPIDVSLLEIRLSIAVRQVETLQRRLRAEDRLDRAFSQLEQSHDDLLSILNHLRLGTALTDQYQRITFLSQSAQNLLGITENQALGRPWKDVFPFSKSEALKLEKRANQPQGEREKVVVSRQVRDNIRNWIEVEVRDDPRSPERKVFLLYDVTEIHQLRRQLDGKARFQDLIGKSASMKQIYQLIQDIANVDTTVLVEGETGTGKELVARAIHALSHRQGKPFIAVNCAGLTESLVSSQLFGHRRGSFTGAVEDRQGMFEAAAGGTIFLDEIGDVPLNVQINLLRVLETREIQRVGEVRTRNIDVRVISATNCNLQELVNQGKFRQDLFYRLRVARITLPPLRERREDIPLLTEWFLRQVSASTGKVVESVTSEAFRSLVAYAWPGNVRELRNTIEFGVIRSRGGEIKVSDLPPEVTESPQEPIIPVSGGKTGGKQTLRAALEKAGGNRSLAAKLLGISRATLYRRLSEFHLDDESK